MVKYCLCLMRFDDDKIFIPGNLVRCEFRLLKAPYQLSRTLNKFQKCRPISYMKMKNENFPGVHKMGLIFPLG